MYYCDVPSYTAVTQVRLGTPVRHLVITLTANDRLRYYWLFSFPRPYYVC